MFLGFSINYIQKKYFCSTGFTKFKRRNCVGEEIQVGIQVMSWNKRIFLIRRNQRWKSANQNQTSTLKCRHSVKPLENGKQFRAVGLSVVCFTDAAVTGKSLHIHGNF